MRRSAPVLRLGVALALATSAPVLAQSRPAPEARITAVAWLAGAWVAEQGPASVEEQWTPPAGGAMLAVSRTVKGERMAAFEFVRIVERDGTLVYIAQPGGRPPTDFVLSEIGTESVTFANPAHDFPKEIRYARRTDGTLEARVSGGGKHAEVFVFRRAS
jgi:hypothetical protein